MIRMFVRHAVADPAKWRAAYDEFAPVRDSLGVTAQAVYQSVDAPNDITVTHDFASLEAARAFVASPELRTAMEKAGVSGPPTIWFTQAT
jgi:hypothetical protein